MSLPDTNKIILAYLNTKAGVTALVSDRIYCPSAPENALLPNITFFTRGGTSTPYIPDLTSPSKQFDCWATDPIVARQVYRALYDALQGLERTAVTIGATTNYILSAIEEVQGQDLVDEIPGRYRVLTFFEIIIR